MMRSELEGIRLRNVKQGKIARDDQRSDNFYFDTSSQLSPPPSLKSTVAEIKDNEDPFESQTRWGEK